MTLENPEHLIEQLSAQLEAAFTLEQRAQLAMIGIHTGGVWIAKALHQRLQLPQPLGTLDISFYRDDFSRIGMHPQVKPSHLPYEIEGKHIVLVDDVLYTGRTIRAAMNELFDYGRPASIRLAALISRNGRELPIEAEFVGIHIECAEQQQIKLSGPEPLELTLSSVN